MSYVSQNFTNLQGDSFIFLFFQGHSSEIVMSEVCYIWDTHPRQEIQHLIEIIVHLWTLKREASINEQRTSHLLGSYSFLCIIATAAIPEEWFDLLLQETDFCQEFQELRSSIFLSLWCEIPPHIKLMTLVCFAHQIQYIFLSGPTLEYFILFSLGIPHSNKPKEREGFLRLIHLFNKYFLMCALQSSRHQGYSSQPNKVLLCSHSFIVQ